MSLKKCQQRCTNDVDEIIDGLHDLLCSTAGGLDVLRDVMIRSLREKFHEVFDDDEL